MRIVVTGGAGYIGSAVSHALVDAGHDVVVLDDLSGGDPAAAPGELVVGDVGDADALDAALVGGDALVHCAARVVVSESVVDPLGYHEANVAAPIRMLRACVDHGVDRIVLSSTAALYASTDELTVDESSPTAAPHPYASSKAILERVLADASTQGLRSLVLRYFNPLGADPAGRTGLRTPRPTHVLERLLDAWGGGAPFTIAGADWPTRDGSAMRDYLHVWDLAEAHVAAVERFDEVVPSGQRIVNLGSGDGTTVRELVEAFERVVGERLDVRVGARRSGDVVGARARIDRAQELLGWSPRRSLDDALRDAIAWSRRSDEAIRDGDMA